MIVLCRTAVLSVAQMSIALVVQFVDENFRRTTRKANLIAVMYMYNTPQLSVKLKNNRNLHNFEIKETKGKSHETRVFSYLIETTPIFTTECEF